ncbi:MAG: GDSL-type esterase/lipase family protein, partial [Acutalibacter sp.]
IQPGKVLMVGSSLMEQFPINELLLDEGRTYTVYNRGIGGYTTQDLAKVLDVCVYDVKPSHIFINIGTNDMNTQAYRLEEMLERYENILQEIQSHLPQAGLTLIAYYPLCERLMAQAPNGEEILKYRNNRVIEEANRGVEALAKKLGVGFVNCNDPITDETGNLKAEYTVEGMHMYADGYAQVLRVLLPLLDQLAG